MRVYIWYTEKKEIMAYLKIFLNLPVVTDEKTNVLIWARQVRQLDTAITLYICIYDGPDSNLSLPTILNKNFRGYLHSSVEFCYNSVKYFRNKSFHIFFHNHLPILFYNRFSSSFDRLGPLTCSLSEFMDLTGCRTPWIGDQPVAKPLLTQKNTNRKHTDVYHTSSGIQSHNPSIWVCENISCLKPRCHYDRPFDSWIHKRRISGKDGSPTFLDTTWTAYKTTRPNILLLLLMYSLPR
jgi:hypothetical protein